MNQHEFRADLETSHALESAQFWNEVYSSLFPGMVTFVRHSQDGAHQRLGVDTTVVMSNSRTFTVDEKIRRQDYPDILVEEWSDRDRQTLGWIVKPLLCDYVLYVNMPGGKAHLLPTLQLQSAWERTSPLWKATRRPVEAYNCDPITGHEWVSVSWPIETEELYPAIGAGLRTRFHNTEEHAV